MNLTTLKEDIAAVIGREPSALAIKLANDEINKRLRILKMRTTVTIAAASGQIALPSDFADMIRLKGPDGAYLHPIDPRLSQWLADSGDAVRYAIHDDHIEFLDGATPDDGDSYTLTYFASGAAPEDGGDTNAAMTYASGAFTYAVLAHHAALIRDNEASASWRSALEGMISDENARAKAQIYKGGNIDVAVPGSVV